MPIKAFLKCPTTGKLFKIGFTFETREIYEKSSFENISQECPFCGKPHPLNKRTIILED